MQGWISLHRQVQKHWLWEDKPFSKGQAWIDILMLVNHEDKKTLMDGKLIEVKRGEHITSEPKLAERWGWSRTKVRNFLKMLSQDGMIENNKEGRKRTRLKVLRYSVYQEPKNKPETKEEQEKDKSKTTEEQVKDINNNDNNVNNENKKNIYVEIIDLLNQKAGTNYKHTTKKTRDYIKARLNEGFTYDDFEKVIHYCCTEWKGKTFSNGQLGDSYLQPSTLFNNKFDERLNKAKLWEQQTQQVNEPSPYKTLEIDLTKGEG